MSEKIKIILLVFALSCVTLGYFIADASTIEKKKPTEEIYKVEIIDDEKVEYKKTIDIQVIQQKNARKILDDINLQNNPQEKIDTKIIDIEPIYETTI